MPEGHNLLEGLDVNAKNKRRVTVSISGETKEQLDSIKHTGQSYEGLIRDLVICWRRMQGGDANRRN